MYVLFHLRSPGESMPASLSVPFFYCIIIANENRYEGTWKDGKKHGPGKFFYLDKGQLFEGFWVADVPKSGTMIDCGREAAPAPTQYPIPKVTASH